MILLFVSGILAALFVVIAEFGIVSTGLLFGVDLSYWEPSIDGIRQSTFIAGIILFAIAEELVKYAVLRKQLTRIGTQARFLPSITFGVGFIIIELGLLFALESNGTGLLAPALGIGAIHLLTSVAYGLIPRTAPAIKRTTILFVGIGSHAFYNIFLALI